MERLNGLDLGSLRCVGQVGFQDAGLMMMMMMMMMIMIIMMMIMIVYYLMKMIDSSQVSTKQPYPV